MYEHTLNSLVCSLMHSAYEQNMLYITPFLSHAHITHVTPPKMYTTRPSQSDNATLTVSVRHAKNSSNIQLCSSVICSSTPDYLNTHSRLPEHSLQIT